jgi:GH24 family phage-related lysozyme (muramidase)
MKAMTLATASASIDRPPTAPTLALLHHFAPALAQDEIMREYRRVTKLLGRYLRPEIISRLNDDMLGAVVSFCMDVGLPIFEQSTLRHRINAGRFLEAVGQFHPHHTRQGKMDRIMRQRRHAEACLFCGFPG